MSVKDYWQGFEGDAIRIAEQTASECGRELNTLKEAFNLYSDAFDRVPPTGNGGAQVARFALLSQNLNSCHVIISSAARGFYIQSLVPLRHVYENWLSFWYLAKFPEEAQRWLDPTWQMRPPKAETMQKGIDHPSKQSKSKLGDFYQELNRFAHTDPASVLSRLQQESEKTLIGVGIRFNADDFRACAYGFSLWIGYSLDAISSLVPQDNDWHSRHAAVREEILSLIDDYNASKSADSSQSETRQADAG